MEREIKETVYMAIDVMLISIVLFMVAVLSYLSTKAYSDKQYADYITSDMGKTAALYTYNDKIVSGSDAVSAIEKYSRMYKFEIKLSESNNYIISFNTEHDTTVNGGGEGAEIWAQEYISNLIGTAIYDNFHSTLIYENNAVIGMRFERLEG